MNSLRVINLEVRNFLGVKAVDISPKGDIVVIEGKNGHGKSSVIGAIWTAIGGSDEMPKKPIHKGKAEAQISVDLGEIIVTRKFTDKGSYLEVRNKDGLKYPSPQKLLDEMYTKVSMDPQAFVAMRPKERREYLLNLTGKRKQIEQIEVNKQIVYDNRTLINREIKNLAGKLLGAPEYEDIQEKSISGLMEKLRKAQDDDRQAYDLNNELQSMVIEQELAVKVIADRRNQINLLKKEIQELETKQTDNENRIEHQRKLIEKFPPSIVPDIRAEIETAEEHNTRVREIKETQVIRLECDTKRDESEIFTRKIDKLEEEKLKILQDASLPVKNIEISGDDILINGIPFDDLSTTEQIKVSMKIGVAHSPKIRVIRIERGSELDTASKEEVKKFAAKNNYQIWMEVVSDKPQEGFFIEQGELRDIPSKKKAEVSA